MTGDAAALRQLVVTAAEVESLAQAARREIGRRPTAAELEARIESWVDEELLLAEARRRGWHRSDPVVRQRLVRNLRFLAVAPHADADELLERGFEMGLDRTDLIVRRRLATRMRLAIVGAARAEPTDPELEALLEASAPRFSEPARVRLRHVFLSRDRRGRNLERDAEQLLERLRSAGSSPATSASRGDPSLLPAELPFSSAAELEARFGADFGRAALALPVRGWQGPVRSSYGLHLVWVHEQRPARVPRLAEVRGAVRAAWLVEREREALHRALAALRRDVEIRVEGGAWTPSTSASKSATASR